MRLIWASNGSYRRVRGMPRNKARADSQKEQSERFKKAVSDAVAVGELSPTEADDAFDSLTRSLSPGPKPKQV